jgi:hypothetical protein
MRHYHNAILPMIPSVFFYLLDHRRRLKRAIAMLAVLSLFSLTSCHHMSDDEKASEINQNTDHCNNGDVKYCAWSAYFYRYGFARNMPNAAEQGAFYLNKACSLDPNTVREGDPRDFDKCVLSSPSHTADGTQISTACEVRCTDQQTRCVDKAHDQNSTTAGTYIGQLLTHQYTGAQNSATQFTDTKGCYDDYDVCVRACH